MATISANKYGGYITTIKTNIYWYGDQTAAVVVPAVPAGQIWEVRILYKSCSVHGAVDSATITLEAEDAEGAEVDLVLQSQSGTGTTTNADYSPGILPMTEGDLIKADIVSSGTGTVDYVRFMAFISKYYI